MGPPSYMWSVVDGNVVMRCMTIIPWHMVSWNAHITTWLSTCNSVKMSLQLRCDRRTLPAGFMKTTQKALSVTSRRWPAAVLTGFIPATFTVRRRTEWHAVNMSADKPPRHVSVLVVHLEKLNRLRDSAETDRGRYQADGPLRESLFSHFSW